jgi:hypothetical protein
MPAGLSVSPSTFGVHSRPFCCGSRDLGSPRSLDAQGHFCSPGGLGRNACVLAWPCARVICTSCQRVSHREQFQRWLADLNPLAAEALSGMSVGTGGGDGDHQAADGDGVTPARASLSLQLGPCLRDWVWSHGEAR